MLWTIFTVLYSPVLLRIQVQIDAYLSINSFIFSSSDSFYASSSIELWATLFLYEHWKKKNTSDKTMLKKIASSPKQQTDEEQLESIA